MQTATRSLGRRSGRTTGDLTGYDHEQPVAYLRLLNAEPKGADWAEVPRWCRHLARTNG